MGTEDVHKLRIFKPSQTRYFFILISNITGDPELKIRTIWDFIKVEENPGSYHHNFIFIHRCLLGRLDTYEDFLAKKEIITSFEVTLLSYHVSY